MTESDAIERIEKCVCASKQNQNLCNDDCKYSADKCVFSLAIQALEKQMPKKPRKTDSYRGILKRVYAYACPACGNVCLEKYMNERQNTVFCWNCGQKLDWSDEDGR